ncbi:threonine/serine exporter family protein [Caldibacillus lycopersici]|uniref:Threonine/serine exporter family protein n=1 Tax=Perspicuibacillus lycopersici TaxID=1325689 RepID=A0AAE3IX10_9BACI|nr:threonine/serine exporter family protein [Perspicuibacillus lycopersici]MCU9614459.1 threonine/serine exporter family protein [Perspicuibacillus lycopersici]
MLAQLVTSFIATSGFGIIFNVPKQALIKCGFVGMVGWLIYYYLVEQTMDSVPASFIAAFFIAVISHVFARKYKTPVIIFTVGGIIPLVPGGLAYDAMRYFVLNDYNMAIQLAAKVLMIAGAIAIGIVFSEVFNQVYRNIMVHLRKNA